MVILVNQEGPTCAPENLKEYLELLGKGIAGLDIKKKAKALNSLEDMGCKLISVDGEIYILRYNDSKKKSSVTTVTKRSKNR